MKKIIIASLAALALPVLASAQVQLISGYNFGQFLGGYPALDGTTGDPVGSIGSNYFRTNLPPADSSGDQVINNGTTGNYSNGTGRLYWDGTAGSSVADYTGGTDLVTQTPGAATINGRNVYNSEMGLFGDNLSNSLRSQTVGNRIAFVQNTLGYADYDPSLFPNTGPFVNDSNLTFAAVATGAPATISWFLNGSNTAFATTNIATGSFGVYSVDLAASFYNQSAATLVAQFSGDVSIDNVQFNGIDAVIPEPSTYAVILGAFSLGFVALRRRFQAQAL